MQAGADGSKPGSQLGGLASCGTQETLTEHGRVGHEGAVHAPVPVEGHPQFCRLTCETKVFFD